MNRNLLALISPPLAVCRHGCAGCCAAPIGVFWVTGIVAVLYGAIWGGPLGLEGPSWGTIGLGVLMWVIAVSWAMLAMRAADADRCREKTSPLCSKIVPSPDEANPLDEVRKAREV
ncbi:MAG: hypothetical protein PVG82_04690 [Chromatiales bacterium]